MVSSLALRRTLRIIFTVCLVVCCVESVWAQNNKQPVKAYLRTTGTILRIVPGFLQVKTKDGGQWIIKVPDKQENISVIGSAEANWLQRGMYVRFTGLFDKRGKATGTVNQLQVFSPDKNTKIGVYPDSGLGLKTTELFAGNEPADTSRPAKRPKGGQSSAFLVAGRLASSQGGKLSILAGRTVVQAQLGETAKISVTVSDPRYARVGDNIELEAWYPENQKAAGRAIATRMKITANKPYGMAKRERPTRKPDARKPEKKPADAAEKKEDAKSVEKEK